MISPNPGPTFDIAEAAAEMQVRKSNPLKDKRRAEEAKVIIYTKKNVMTDS